jgi:putative transposase
MLVVVTGSSEWMVQAYRFALDPTRDQLIALAGHCHASRSAFNVMLAAVRANMDQRAAERSYGLGGAALTPAMNWSAYALLREWNRRKHQVAPWWCEYSKEAYASGCANLAAALGNWKASRRGERAGRRAGFPRFKARHRVALSCRFTTGAIRVESGRHHVTLPVIGTIKTHESTRKLARRLEAGTARITTATIAFERGRWFVSFTAHVQRRIGRPAHAPRGAPVVGIDLGVCDLLVAATPDGDEVARVRAPRPLTHAQSQLRALQRRAARQHGPREPGIARGTPREPSEGWLAQTMGEIAPGGSGPLDSGGADRKTMPPGMAGGCETATPPGTAPLPPAGPPPRKTWLPRMSARTITQNR